MKKTLIERVTVGSGGAASITFSAIPDTFTDLLLVCSLRSAQSQSHVEVFISFNSSTTGFSARQLYGNGSSAASSTPARQAGLLPAAFTAANTFNNSSIYIPNYRSGVAKSYSVESVTEDNTTLAYQNIVAGLWSGTDLITSITLTNTGSNNFVEFSSASLYGISKGSDGTTTVS